MNNITQYDPPRTLDVYFDSRDKRRFFEVWECGNIDGWMMLRCGRDLREVLINRNNVNYIEEVI